MFSLLSVAVIAGCDGGPELVEVGGKVTKDGSPLPSGSLVFYPEGHALPGNALPRGSIQPDGGYVIQSNGKPGAPVGKYRVTVTSQSTVKPPRAQANPMGLYPLVDTAFSSFDSTPLRAEVTNESGKSYDFEVE